MKLIKRFSSMEILEALRDLVEDSLEPNLEGELHLRWDDEDGVEVFFTERDLNAHADETWLN